MTKLDRQSPGSESSARVAILGAGLSGLCAAWFLKKLGLTTTLFESAAQAGGMIRTGKEDGFQFEYGPNSLLLQGGDLADLIIDLGLESELIEANTKANKRFIVHHGQPVAAPMSLLSFITSPLLSTQGKIRLLTEPFRPKSKEPDESLATFVERRLGREALDYLLNPFVSGVYAGTPEKLSTRYSFPLLWELEQRYGSLVSGFLRRPRTGNPKTKRKLVSFRQGIQTLTNALANHIGGQLLLNTPAQSIRRDSSHWFINDEPFDAIVSTLPWHQYLALPSEIKNQPSPLYKGKSEISYPPITVWHLGFHRHQILHPLDGFGLLVPEVEKLNILGCLFPSTLFPGRSPNGEVLLTVFIGGSRKPDLALLDPEDSLKIVLLDLSTLLGLTGEPCWKKSIPWPKAIPQYDLEHGTLLKNLTDYEKQNTGLFFSGNYRDGISVGNCVSGARRVSEEVKAFCERL
jgi:protoporphyrinogen/coproporphyrinogen III oxidase